ncbi:hypothetical protein MFRU_003g03290 [Monilinia fructicola]|nr:hypothetical protein MFRU_003g03290 [Monilinia fructicola]
MFPKLSSARLLNFFNTRPYSLDAISRSLIPSSNNLKAPTQAFLQKELTSRQPNIIYDYLSPTPSHLLNISLADFLPPSCYAPNFRFPDFTLPNSSIQGRDECSHTLLLPQSHHLVYFPTQISDNALLSDGTDPLQSPGLPFVRRMWSGGSVVFNTKSGEQLCLNNIRAACVERIADVSIKGNEGDEKVFVNIERRVGLADTGDDPQMSSEESGAIASKTSSVSDQNYMADQRLLRKYLVDKNDNIGQASLVEMRNIVFMREKDTKTAKEDRSRPPKILRPTRKPDFDVRITPSQSLLFRFSALTFNAHAIHLDPQYCREVEGHKDLLLHGPLSLVFMISVLRSQLRPGEMIKRFDYRNLAPLYANEELRVCVGKKADKNNKYEVWIEGKEGGYAVKGSAVVGPLDNGQQG